MIMASMLAMVMLAASPALAQTQSSEQNAQGNNINQLSQQCQNVIGDINVEGGDQTATGGDQYAAGEGNVNAQEIAQEQNITVNVAQTCINQAAQANVDIEAPAAPAPAPDDDQYEAPAPDDDQYEAPADDQYVAPEGDDDAAAGAGAAAPAGDDAAAAPAEGDAAEGDAAEGGAVAVLPDTGGASLFTLGAGALLVAGGLLARKIVR